MNAGSSSLSERGAVLFEVHRPSRADLGSAHIDAAGAACRSLVMPSATMPPFPTQRFSFFAESSDLLCRTTEIRHVFSEDAVQHADAPGLLMA